MHFITSAAKRMRLLIDALLSYGQVGKRPVVFAKVDCSNEVQKILDLLRAEIDQVGANIIIAPLPAITADGVLLGQVFQNLISNSIKYHGDKIPEIHIKSTENSTHWTFSVQDNGVGFSKRDEQRVFKIFQRLQNNEDAIGSGIGLALCKKIIELHGGQIWAESEIGKGAVFHFSIPKTLKKSSQLA
jgi:light-regulated signal transduction histidine kinase (bacteriophytochrome)